MDYENVNYATEGQIKLGSKIYLLGDEFPVHDYIFACETGVIPYGAPDEPPKKPLK